MGLARLSLILTLLWSGPAAPHEFWIEPAQYQVESGTPLVADLKNGENFKGITLPWFESRFQRFEIVQGDDIRPVEGRMGDTPALQGVAPDAGLVTIAHETTEQFVTYTEWEKFAAFVEHKDFPDALRAHETQGWSKDRFREAYTRHAKALVAVDGGAGSDRALGLVTEFIARTNPYATAFDGMMHIELLYQGAPRAEAQVEVFERAPDGTVAITLYRTDRAGTAQVPVKPGHAYLFDAVVLRPSDRAGSTEDAPLWETFWAALTFAVPAR